jgi:hypothetical protein
MLQPDGCVTDVIGDYIRTPRPEVNEFFCALCFAFRRLRKKSFKVKKASLRR